MLNEEKVEEIEEAIKGVFYKEESVVVEVEIEIIDEEIVIYLTLSPELAFFDAEEELIAYGYNGFIKTFRKHSSQDKIDEAFTEAKNMNESTTNYFKNAEVVTVMDNNLEDVYKEVASILSVSLNDVKKIVTINTIVEEDSFDFYNPEDFFLYIDEEEVIEVVREEVSNLDLSNIKARDYFKDGLLYINLEVEGYDEAEAITAFDGFEADLKFELARLYPPIYDYEFDTFVEINKKIS